MSWMTYMDDYEKLCTTLNLGVCTVAIFQHLQQSGILKLGIKGMNDGTNTGAWISMACTYFMY